MQDPILSLIAESAKELGASQPRPASQAGGVEGFVQQYGPVAQRVGGKIGVEPAVLLGQWGLETGWGRSVIPGTNNLGNIKDFTGAGPQATDNMTGSRDAYRAYESPDSFGEDFAGLIARRYRTAAGSGSDAGRYFAELKKGGYAEDPDYVNKGVAAARMAATAMGGSLAAAPPQQPTSRFGGPRSEMLDPRPPAPTRSRGVFEAINDTVIEFGNAVAGAAGAVGSFVSPGNQFSQAVEEFIQSGVEKQSDVVRAEKERLAADMEAAPDASAEVTTMLGYMARNPALTAAQVAGSFVLPGAAVKGASSFAQAVGVGARGAARAGLAGGAVAGATMGGGDAAGTAYELVMKSPDDVILQSPDAQQLIRQGITDPAQIKEAIAQKAAAQARVLPAILGAATGVIGAERLLAGLPGAGRTRVGNALATGGIEGSTEAVEEAATVIEGQRAAAQYNPEIDSTKGAAGAATMGFVGGAGVGAVAGALQSPEMAPVIQKAQEPNSPLSKSAVAGTAASPPVAPVAPPDPAARLAELEAIGQQGGIFTPEQRKEYEALNASREATPGAQPDEIAPRLAAIKSALNPGVLDALRAEGSDYTAKDLLKDLAVASSKSAQPTAREQALTRIETGLQWAGANPAPTVEPNIDEITGATQGDVRQPGARPGIGQLRTGVDRDAALTARAQQAGTQFERDQINAQRKTNLEMRLGARPANSAQAVGGENRPQAVTPAEQARLEAAALGGQVDASKRQDEPRQAVIDRALRNVEERGGVASPAEAQIFAEAGLGKPYDRIDESLAPPPSTDERLTQATGIALGRRPRETVVPGRQDVAAQAAAEQQARSDSRMKRLAEERAAAAAKRDQAQPKAPAGAPPADDVIAALKTIPALRTAEQKAVVDAARARMTAEQMRVLQDAAVNPANLSATDKLQLQQMREPRRSAERAPWREGETNTLEQDGATIEYNVLDDKVTINDAAVRPESRGRGAFRRAMQSLLARADEAGLPVELMAFDATGFSDDARLERFYESLGFRTVGRDDGAAIMRRQPSAATKSAERASSAPAETAPRSEAGSPAEPAVIRKRRRQLDALADQGYETVERRDGVFFIRNSRTGDEVRLSGRADAALARAAVKAMVDARAHAAATSPQNDRKEPTPAQKAAGNYKLGMLRFDGLDIAIENPEGSVRSGTDRGGKKWSVRMKAHYGYIRRTLGADGDGVDIYLHASPTAGAPVFVIDQYNDDGTFDETKSVVGAQSRDEAIRIYDAHFSDGSGPRRRGDVTQMSVDEFKSWARSDAAKKPAGVIDARARNIPDAGVQQLAKGEKSLRRSQGPGVPGVRGEGDQDERGVGGELRGVSAGRGAEADSGALPGSNQGGQRVRAGQRTLGNQDGAESEQAGLRARADAPRQDDDIGGVGSRAGNSGRSDLQEGAAGPFGERSPRARLDASGGASAQPNSGRRDASTQGVGAQGGDSSRYAAEAPGQGDGVASGANQAGVTPALSVDPDRAPGTTFTVRMDGKNVEFKRADVSQLAETESPERDGKARRISRKSAALISAIGAAMGKRVQFFEDVNGERPGDGFVRPADPDTIYLNTVSTINPLSVFGHEFLHTLRQTNPQAWDAIAAVVKTRVKNPKGFRRDYYGAEEADARGDGALSEERDGELEELVSDLGGNLMADQSFWREVFAKIYADNGKDAKGTIARLIAQLQGLIDMAVAAVKGPRFRADRFISDMDAIRAAYRDGLAAYLKESGKSKAGMQAEVLRSVNGVSMSPARKTDDKTIYWHGSPSGDLRGGSTGLHLGTKLAATQALEARIGVPATGEWDGAREYGSTLLAGKKTLKRLQEERGYFLTTGLNAGSRGNPVPDEDYLPQVELKYADGTPMPMSVRPSVRPFRLNTEMSNFKFQPHEDFKANGYMSAAKKRGTARRGYYYSNVAEDSGSISVVVPDGSHVTPVDDSEVTKSPERGIHFSKKQLTAINGAYYGTGLKGLEAERLALSDDPRLKTRVYFYVDEGNGVRPEAGVGGYAHEVELPKLYDAKANAEKLWNSGDLNGTESRILDAGYAGYFVKKHETGQGFAVVIGDAAKSMPAKPIANPKIAGPISTGVPETIKAAPSSKEIDLIDVGNIPGATLRAGMLRFPADSREQANAEMARIGSDLRFSKERLSTPAEEVAAVRKQYEGTDKWLKAPDGTATRLTERQWLHVRTPSFKKWFGDFEKFAGRRGGVWADDKGEVSKVVGRNGEPLVVYHGTDKGGFSEFSRPGGSQRGDLGIFTTDERGVARTYVHRGRARDIGPGDIEEDGEYRDPVAGIYALFINIRNPQESDFEGANWDGSRNGQYMVVDDDGEQLYADDGRGYFEDRDDAFSLVMSKGGNIEPAQDHYETTDSVVREARRSKNDGAIIRQVTDDGGGGGGWYEASDVFVAFEPNQVKSADFNDSTYSADEDDIRRSAVRDVTEAPEFKRWFGNSKVADSRGRPLAVYHGSGSPNIRSFRRGVDGAGWFSESPGLASQFAEEGGGGRGDTVYPVYLALQNPLDVNTPEGRAIMAQANNDRPGLSTEEQLSPLGYDGVIANEGGGRVTYLAFRPEQIKSVFNRGTFDATDPDITRSVAREPRERVHGFEVSTREPYAKPTKDFAPEDSRRDLLISDFASGLGQSKWLSAVSELVEGYPNYRAAATANAPEKKLERTVRQMVENLLWLHDQVPADTRNRSKLWYDGARAIAERWSRKYSISDAQAAGILAVLSPQKDWFMNVSLANRVADIMTDRQAFRWSKQMDETSARIFGKEAYQEDIDAIRGQTLQDLDDAYLRAMWLRVYDQAHNPSSFYIVSPEGDFVAEARTKDGTLGRVAWGGNSTIAKAVSVFDNGSFENISAQLGRKHKVRNFYNNILVPNSPNGHVTIDTHAVAAALLRPLSGNSIEVMHNFGGPKSAHAGLEGTYALYEEAYRRAAAERGILPREMQSIAWEAVRGLFVPTFKAQRRNVEAVDGVWTQFQKGRLSYENARKQVLELAGGIEAPSWAGRDPGAYVEDEPAADDGDLAADGVPAGDSAADGGDSGRRAGASARRSRARDGERGDEGRSLAPLAGAPSIAGATGPDPRLVEVAERYAASRGIQLRRQAEYVKVDPERAKRIAEAYDAMPHAPQDPAVKAAYQDLIQQTRAQYDALVGAGYKFWFMDPEADPYAGNPWNAMRDLRANQRMAVFPTAAGFGTSDFDPAANPLLADAGLEWGFGSPDGQKKRVLVNDLFRAVHDAFGHGLEGAGFRADGEENAWQAHVRLFTGPAVGAITSETRGQNSFLNYGPHGEKNRTAKVADTVFADQKTGLMPDWTWTEGRAEDAVQGPSAPPSPPADLVKIFEDMRSSPGARKSAKAAAAAHPLSAKIQEIERDFLDILDELETSQVLGINCD